MQKFRPIEDELEVAVSLQNYVKTVCSVYHSHAVISKCTMIIFNKNTIYFVQFFANSPLFLRSFGDLQHRLNHL
jgi:hypothetical protein